MRQSRMRGACRKVSRMRGACAVRSDACIAFMAMMKGAMIHHPTGRNVSQPAGVSLVWRRYGLIKFRTEALADVPPDVRRGNLGVWPKATRSQLPAHASKGHRQIRAKAGT